MTKSLFAATAASLLLLPAGSRADDSLKEEKDKVSYSIGVDMGRNLQQQGIEINPEILSAGIKDGFGGAPLKMTDEEMSNTMQAFMAKVQAKAQERQQAASSQNKTKGEAYLAENKKKEGWKTTPSGLQYHIVTTGTGEKPKASDTVVTQYRGTTIDGTEFDSSYKRNEPAEFPVNAVIPGWTEALQMMPVGSKWQIAIPPALAYGEQAPPKIGPNSVLLFDLELLGIKTSGTDSAATSPAPK